MSESLLAWHFLSDKGKLANGDRRREMVGRTLVHRGPLVLCEGGLHASVRAIDALQYAPGPWVCRVECGGKIVRGDDKLVCSRRKTLAMVDATDTLRHFARLCALDVIDKWDAPAIVREYLETGDESKRAAARAAAWDAARDAAWAAAWAAARYARDAAWAAARDAAWDARDAQSRRLVALLGLDR